MRPRPPIFAIDRSGPDIAIFESVDAAEAFLEPIDVLNDEDLLFDADARRLKARVDRRKTRIEVQSERIHREELASRIFEFLDAIGALVESTPDDWDSFVHQASSMITQWQHRSGRKA